MMQDRQRILAAGFDAYQSKPIDVKGFIAAGGGDPGGRPPGRRLMASPPAKILVVDDTPQNVKLLADLLTVKGYEVVTAASGAEALARIEAERPDLVLLDVVMPGMSGYEVCQRIRADAANGIMPVVMVTALDPSAERIKGLDAGADDFLTKPINLPELLARVRSLLRIKELYDTVEAQSAQLAELNRTLEQRVADQVGQLERLSKLKRFFSPQLAELIVSGGADDPLRTHRRDVTVVFLDLRGYTAFAETAEPEEVMGVLREYHREMGTLVVAHEGTLERFAGDGMMVFFNDPVVVPNPDERAVRMALAMRDRVTELAAGWRKRGYELDVGPRAREGVRHHRRHRLRGPVGLRRDRQRDQSRLPPVQRGAARPGARRQARGGGGRGPGRGRGGGGSRPQGLRPARRDGGAAEDPGSVAGLGAAIRRGRPVPAPSSGPRSGAARTAADLFAIPGAWGRVGDTVQTDRRPVTA